MGRRGATSGLLIGGTSRAPRAAARHVGLPPLPRSRLPDGVPRRRVREGPGDGNRQAPRRSVLRLSVLHAGLPVRRAQVQPSPKASSANAIMCSGPTSGRGGAGLRAGLPPGSDFDPPRRDATGVEDSETNLFLPGAPEPQHHLSHDRLRNKTSLSPKHASGRLLLAPSRARTLAAGGNAGPHAALGRGVSGRSGGSNRSTHHACSRASAR